MLTIYLAGAIYGQSDAVCKSWRDEVSAALSGIYAVLDPMARDYRGREEENVRAIVEDDLTDIKRSHIVLVHAHAPSWGTAMEVRAAKAEFGREVYVIASGSISPWLRYHADRVFPTTSAAIEHLLLAMTQ